MDIFIQQVMNGLVLGSIYALIALGYTMVYGILGIINFAHGEVLMVGALTALSTIAGLKIVAPGLPDWLTLVIATLIAMSVCGLLSYTIERVAYRPLRNAPRLAPLITAIGVSIILQTLAMIIWSRNPLIFPELLPSDPIDIFTTGATITGKEIVIIVMALVVMSGLLILVNKTKLGRAMRATAENLLFFKSIGKQIIEYRKLLFCKWFYIRHFSPSINWLAISVIAPARRCAFDCLSFRASPAAASIAFSIIACCCFVTKNTIGMANCSAWALMGAMASFRFVSRSICLAV